MKLILQHANVRVTDYLDSWVEECLRSLLPLIRIEEARIRVEYSRESSPPYRAIAHLLVPGPDLRVEASDFTARTAFAKVMAQLKEGAVHRAARRIRKSIGDRRVPAFLPPASARR
jgi:ribosome-associated translation inhibitor RaiA